MSGCTTVERIFFRPSAFTVRIWFSCPADGALHERDFQLHYETPSLAQQLFDGLAAQARDLFRGLQTAQALDRRLDDVDGVVGAVRLGDDIPDAGRLDGPHAQDRRR